MVKLSHFIYICLGIAFLVFGMNAVKAEYFYVGWGTGNNYVEHNHDNIYQVQNNYVATGYAYPVASYTTYGYYVPGTAYYTTVRPAIYNYPVAGYGYGYYGYTAQPNVTVSYAYKYT